MQEPLRSRTAGERLVFALELLLGMVALWRIAQFFVAAPTSAPFQYDYEEGNILNAVVRILHGDTPYPNPHALPNIINPYGPAAYYLLAIPAKIFGVAFLYPRAMVLVCALGTAVLLGFELRRRTGSPALGAVIGATFLAIPNVQHWMWMLRVDLLGLAFTLGGLILFSRDLERNPERPRLLVPACLFAVAALVKITLAAAPGACFAALVLRRRYVVAAKLTGMTAALFAVVLAIFAAVTHGAAITDIFLSHADPFSFAVFTQGLTQMMVASWPLVGLAVVGLARDLSERRFSPAALWIVFATVSAVTAGKLGSNSNHFLEWNAALVMAAGLGLAEFTRIGRRAVLVSGAALAVTAAAVAMQPRFAPESAPNRDCMQASAWMRAHPGANILSENVGALVLSQQKVWVSNPFVLAQLVEHAGWSDADLVNMVRARRFDAIFTGLDYTQYSGLMAAGTERFSSEMLRAIRDNYEATPGFTCLDMNVLYQPKPANAIQSKEVTGRPVSPP